MTVVKAKVSAQEAPMLPTKHSRAEIISKIVGYVFVALSLYVAAISGYFLIFFCVSVPTQNVLGILYILVAYVLLVYSYVKKL